MNDPVHARPVPPSEPDTNGTGICSEDGHQLDRYGDCPLCGLSFVAYPPGYKYAAGRDTNLPML